MKILLLGAKGNLGTQIIEVFKDHDLVAWDREDIDITDKELIIKKIKDLKPNVVINAAAYNAVDKCEDDENEFELAKRINGEAPGHLAQGCLGVGATFVHYSSDYVFGGEKKYGYDEEAETNPISNYGRSKLLGEKNIITLSGKRLKYYIIRTSKLFGPKAASETAKPSFFDIMLKLSREREEIDVVDEEKSCFTYTPDLALYTRKLLESESGYGIYHFINEGACTWFDAARELFKIINSQIKVNPVTGDKFPRPARRPKYSVLKNTKFEKLRDYKKALKEYLSLSSL